MDIILNDKLVSLLCVGGNYREEIPNPDYDSENPESKKVIPNIPKNQFAESEIIEVVKRYALDVQNRMNKQEIQKANETSQAVIKKMNLR